MGNGRRGAGARIFEAVWVGERVERAHSSGDAEGGGECDVSHGDVDRVSAAAAGDGTVARADESAGGQASRFAGRDGCELRSREQDAGSGGFDAGLADKPKREFQ